MSRADHFLGAMLIFSTVAAFALLALDAVTQRPNALGAIMAICTLGSGLMVCRSIWRDRL